MAEFYTFDPSADIQKGFQKAGAGIADIFSHLVATQKRDNEIADKMFQNIEALKKDVNIYGQKVITDKTNTLLKDASKVILEGGKLDYSQLGSIRQRVSDIADDKKKYELGAELRKEYMQLGLANKDNLTSLEGFIKGITAPLMDPNIKNATDLQAAMQAAYDKSLNLDRIGVKSVMNILPEEQIKGYGTNQKGDLVNYEFKGLKGSSYDVSTGKVIGPDAQKIKDVAATMKAQMPNYFDDYRKRIGVNEDILPDNVIAKKLIDQIGVNQGQALNQSATSVKKEEEQLKALETENKFGERKILAGIDLTEAQAWRIRNPIEKEGGGLNLNFGGGRTKENVNSFLKITDNSGKGGKAPSYLSTTISKPFAMNLEGYSVYSKDPKNPNKKIQTPLGDFEVNGVKKISGNRFIISGLQAPTQSTADRYSVLGANAPTGNRKRVNITLDEKGFDSLMNRLHGMGDADQVENLNTIEKMRYLSTTDEALNSKTPMKMSYIYNKAQQEGKPILLIMRDAKEAGFKIYED
jgi:hypothetical protein